MKTYILTLVLTAFIGRFGPDSIIIRHDKKDNAYIEFAKSLPVTSAIVKYNSTDVAGTLIRPNWILSAAHVAEFVEEGQRVILGKDSLVVEKIIIHPGWLDNGRPEDIALIRVKNKISGVNPISLYKNRDEMGQEVIVAGNGDFGTGETGPTGNDGKFRAATNLVDEATNEYLIWDFDDPREHPDKVTLLEGISGPGDSSGPAFIKVDNKYLIAGISSGQSTNTTDGKEGLYGVTEYYTRVSTYINWIEQTIADN